MTIPAQLSPLAAEPVTQDCRHCGSKIARGTGGDTKCYGQDGIPVPDGHEAYVVGER